MKMPITEQTIVIMYVSLDIIMLVFRVCVGALAVTFIVEYTSIVNITGYRFGLALLVAILCQKT